MDTLKKFSSTCSLAVIWQECVDMLKKFSSTIYVVVAGLCGYVEDV